MEIYDSSGRKLNLSVCKEDIKVMKYIGDVAEELNIQSAMDLAEKGIDVFNASDAFDKFHTNKLASTPRFDRMISRPQRNNLPSFMQGLYNRLGADTYTEKSLQLNNYSNGDNYIDIYKNDLSIAKQKQSEYDFSFLWDENNKEIEDNKINKS